MKPKMKITNIDNPHYGDWVYLCADFLYEALLEGKWNSDLVGMGLN